MQLFVTPYSQFVKRRATHVELPQTGGLQVCVCGGVDVPEPRFMEMERVRTEQRVQEVVRAREMKVLEQRENDRIN